MNFNLYSKTDILIMKETMHLTFYTTKNSLKSVPSLVRDPLCSTITCFYSDQHGRCSGRNA